MHISNKMIRDELNNFMHKKIWWNHLTKMTKGNKNIMCKIAWSDNRRQSADFTQAPRNIVQISSWEELPGLPENEMSLKICSSHDK